MYVLMHVNILYEPTSIGRTNLVTYNSSKIGRYIILSHIPPKSLITQYALRRFHWLVIFTRYLYLC